MYNTHKKKTNQFIQLSQVWCLDASGRKRAPTDRKRCPFPSTRIHASNWRKISKLIVYFCVAHRALRKRGLPRKFSHFVLSCPVEEFFLTSCVCFVVVVVVFSFSERWQWTLFQFFVLFCFFVVKIAQTIISLYVFFHIDLCHDWLCRFERICNWEFTIIITDTYCTFSWG